MTNLYFYVECNVKLLGKTYVRQLDVIPNITANLCTATCLIPFRFLSLPSYRVKFQIWYITLSIYEAGCPFTKKHHEST
jgi:hypothetical protein